MMLRPMPRYAPYLAEALGTFALVFAGPGAIAVDAASDGAVGGVGIGMSFGLIVMVMIYALGHISGCHINPAVTVAFRVLGRISTIRALAYIGAQLAGAVLAGLAIVAIVGDAGDAGASAPRIGGTSWRSSFLLWPPTRGPRVRSRPSPLAVTWGSPPPVGGLSPTHR
jgi:glycerol uptake facilitator-like aquaporin